MSPSDIVTHREARFCPSGLYRYSLVRELVSARAAVANKRIPRRACWIMLNPSTADDLADDATVRRVISFTARLGCDVAEVVNLYALISTDPRELRRAFDRGEDIVGSENEAANVEAMRGARESMGLVIAAFGDDPMGRRAWADVYRRADLAGVDVVHCLGETASGAPRHPVRLAGGATLAKWWDRAEHEAFAERLRKITEQT